MSTIQDVAKRAGVAPITVSRVINNKGYVTHEVRERVLIAIAELGYVPNALARSMRTKRTNTLALVVSDITNPFFTTVARGVEDAASDAGFMVMMGNTDERETEERRYVEMLLSKQVDGILLVPVTNANDSIDFLKRHETMVVALDRRIEEGRADVVRSDSVGGAFELGRLLESLGHRAIAMLAGPKGVSTAEDRVKGFRQAMDGDSRRTVASVFYGEYTQDSGYTMVMQALTLHPRPTALFAGNNFIAIGALRALRDSGLRVPEDMALVSFDDLPSGLITFPFLTVVAQPAYEMGRKAVDLLIQRLNGGAPDRFQEVEFPTELIIRQSSGGRVVRA